MSEKDSFLNTITTKLNDNLSSVCESLNQYKVDINLELETFNNNINNKISQLYDIIEDKQHQIKNDEKMARDLAKAFEEEDQQEVAASK